MITLPIYYARTKWRRPGRVPGWNHRAVREMHVGQMLVLLSLKPQEKPWWVVFLCSAGLSFLHWALLPASTRHAQKAQLSTEGSHLHTPNRVSVEWGAQHVSGWLLFWISNYLNDKNNLGLSWRGGRRRMFNPWVLGQHQEVLKLPQCHIFF